MIRSLLGDDDKESDQPGEESTASGVDGLGSFETVPEPVSDAERASRADATPDEIAAADSPGLVFKIPYEPESQAETIRNSGLAWSAGIVFFASIAFMLILGWGADLLFGSSPWGIVVGIVTGSLIGFIQFFRLTSQIFKK